MKLETIDDYDIIVFCRNCEYMDLEYIYYAKSKGKKVLYELDDNYFTIDIRSELGRYHRYPGRLYVVRQFLELSDLVHVYSNPLLEIASKYNASVKKINSYFDFSLIQNKKRDSLGKKIKIVYATSRQENDELIKTFDEALKRIVEKYGEKIEIYVFGSIPSKLKKYNIVKQLPYIKDYNKFVQFFYEQSFDIGLAPLIDDIFHRSKTNNKFREYGACGIAGVYSNIDVYTDCIEDGTTGLIVNNTVDEWEVAVERLVCDDELRKQISTNAKEVVMDHYSFDHAINTWQNSIQQLKQAKLEQTMDHIYLKKRSILIVVKKEYNKSNIRMKACIEALAFMGIKYDILFLETYLKDENIGNSYNLVIVFTGSELELPSYETLNVPIILDTQKLFEENKAFSTVIKNSKNNKIDGSVTSIRSYIDFDKNRKYMLEELLEYYSGASLTDTILQGNYNPLPYNKFEKVFRVLPRIVRNNESVYYSLNSPVIKWIDLIQGVLEFEQFKAPTMMNKIKLKAKTSLLKITAPYKAKAKVVNNRIYILKLLYNINKKGKYK